MKGSDQSMVLMLLLIHLNYCLDKQTQASEEFPSLVMNSYLMYISETMST